MTGTQSGDVTRHVVSRHSQAKPQPEAPVQEVLVGQFGTSGQLCCNWAMIRGSC